jgi:hypothetical protein
MNTWKPAQKPLLLYLVSLVLVATSCVTIKEGTACAVAGKLSAGGICSHLISDKTGHLSFSEMIDFLEAQPERTCVPVPGMSVCADDQSMGIAVKLSARGAALAMSADDWGTMKTELEVACRMLGKRCTYMPSVTSSMVPPQ